MQQQLDYQSYGNTFRQPRPLRPDGGPQNNQSGLNGFDSPSGSTNVDGRPPKQQQQGQGTPMTPGAPQPQNSSGGDAPPQMSFRQMQSSGMARPPMPMPMQAQGQSPMDTGSGPPQQGGGLENQLYGAYQGYNGPAGFGGQAQRAQTPGAYQGQGFNGQYSAYQTPGTNQTGQFGGQGGQGSQVDSQTGQSVMQGLQNPSRWDNSLISDNYNKLAGQIDDQYNQADQNLQGSLAQRGLGATGDSTIGANDARYQNLQRRTAKSDALQNIMTGAANTQAADRAQAISAGLGYGGQQYGQGLSTYGANMGANQQNFGQNMQASQFGADQQAQQYNTDFARSQYNTGLGQQGYQNQMQNAQFDQGANQQDYQNQAQNYGLNQQADQQGFNNKQSLLNNYLGYGQQGFQNQLALNQQQQGQDQQQYQNMLAMLGY